ncbi:major capsid protein [Mesoterricola sediminis]|uniref:Uncharacterized protein n=1 Tax=Mesoterricola sediminis TaxID=2927980 RepID=A0AA48KCQ4_9BACT|nr:major capsid protein [Mesoterricola sediminis]BDU76295.1 hypothetical protein METESE_12530 [Mesoterricola sediminis]
MAIGKASDFVIYQDQFQAGVWEAITQNVNVFNGASAGAIKLVAKDLKGDFNKDTFFKTIAGLVSRRDTTSTATVADTALAQGENIGVKLNRKIGPIALTLDSLRKIGSSSEEISFGIGRMVGERKAVDMLNGALIGATAALGAQSSVLYDATADTTKTLNHTAMVSGMAKFGDQSARIKAWVMHSKPYFDLVKQAIGDKIVEVAGVTIYSGNVATFNRPTIVTDAAPLLVSGSPNTYPILGLVEGGIVVTESEQQEIATQLVTGLENLVHRIQGEFAYNLNIMGFQWDVTNGGANPNDTALGTGTNWDPVVTSYKDYAGIYLKVQ